MRLVRPVPPAPLLSLFATRGDAWVAAALALASVAIYLGSALGQRTAYDYFGRLAVALAGGRYWLDDAPPHLNELVRGVGGHLYSVAPPLPALLLVPLVPFGPPGAIQTFLSALLGGASAAPLFLAQRALGIPRPLAILVTTLSALGTTLWVSAADGRSWFAADAIAVFFGSLALWASAARAPFVLLGAALGAATLARLPLIIAAPGLLLLAARSPRVRLGGLAAFVGGLAPFAIAYAAYNLARWGTPLDVGYARLSAGDPFYPHGLFSFAYLPRHVYAILFEPPAFIDGEPFFLRARSIGMSIVVTTPPMLWLARTAVEGRSFWASGPLALACAAIVPDVLFGTVGFEQYGYRRSLDVQPFLMGLVAVGAGWTGDHWQPLGSTLFRMAVGLSVAVTLYFLITIRLYGFAP